MKKSNSEAADPSAETVLWEAVLKFYAKFMEKYLCQNVFLLK